MKAPKNAQIYETPISIHWFDENGIFCSISKEGERTIEHYQKVFDLYEKVMKENVNLCILSEVSNANTPMNQEVRKFVADEMPKYVKAHAIISKNQLGYTQAMTVLKLTFMGYEIEMFPNENEAKEWLKTYL